MCLVILCMKILYIHGYGSNGQAYKAKLLSQMMPDCEVISPTFDYDRLSPEMIIGQLRQLVSHHAPAMIMGSSMGGYFALCCLSFYRGKVWCINPVRDVVSTIRMLAQRNVVLAQSDAFAQRLQEYHDFNQRYFVNAHAHDGQLHLALSTDDEVLGDHRPLLDLFPNAAQVVWKEDSGHVFLRFNELADVLAQQEPIG